MTDREYLEKQLMSAKAELNNIRMNHGMAIAVYNEAEANLDTKIFSLEKQLGSGDA